MKKKNFSRVAIFALILGVIACNNDKEAKQTTKEDKTVNTNPTTQVPASTYGDFVAPDYNDPELKQYYVNYTAYIKSVAAAIQNKDEATAMRLFADEGKNFKDNNEMEKKAQAESPEKFTAWLTQSLAYQRIIIQSDYFKKFNDEYYKKVNEKFKEKGY